jgi:hypothetical protein
MFTGTANRLDTLVSHTSTSRTTVNHYGGGMKADDAKRLKKLEKRRPASKKALANRSPLMEDLSPRRGSGMTPRSLPMKWPAGGAPAVLASRLLTAFPGGMRRALAVARGTRCSYQCQFGVLLGGLPVCFRVVIIS